MIRLILSAVGILLMCSHNEHLFALGLYCIFPGLITVISKIIKWLIERAKDKQRWIDYYNRLQAEQAAEKKKMQDQLREQARLVEKYKNSPIVTEMLRVLCGAYPPTLLPIQITICDNCVKCSNSETTRMYSFSQHRIDSFKPVIRTVFSREELKYIVRPQIAMADAINARFSNKYHISDYAKEEFKYYKDSDGDSYTTITYVSDHVVMVLKDTLPNRTF